MSRQAPPPNEDPAAPPSRGRSLRRGAIALLVGGLAAGPVAALCGPPDLERPRIGLALAGGGAKGGAHIGVLQVLEELRVPVDCVAGTSMGSIIGGLYASGLSPQELEATVSSIDWADVMEDEPSRRELTFRRREDQQRYLLDLEVGVKRSGLVLPTGLRSGQKLFLLLETFTLPVAEIEDFDRLPIPFRAVATDIQRGEAVVLDHGNLAWALRASMAIPSVFTPVEIDGRLLVDGGITNNVPVDVVRAMGADVVIGVDLGAPLSEREVRSVVQIVQQMQRMLTRGNMEPQLAAADLVVHPPVAEYGTLAFDDIEAITAAGAEEARLQAGELRRYAVTEEEYERWRAGRSRPELFPLTVTGVRLEGNRRVDSRIILAQTSVRAGQPLDLAAVSGDARRIYGLEDFEQVYFSFERTAEGADLIYHLVEKPWGPNYLHFGFSYESDFEGRTAIQLLTNLTATRLNARGAECRTDLLLGTELGASSEFYQPLGFRSGWFVAPRADYLRRRVDLFEDDERVAEFSARLLRGGFDLGYEFGRWGEARLGPEWVRVSADLETGELPAEVDPADLEGATLGAVVAELTIDRLDSVTFPRDGGFAHFLGFLSTEQLGADSTYDKLAFDAGQFLSPGRHTLFGTLSGGWSPGSDLPLYDQFTVGGLFSLSGLENDQRRADSFAIARLGYYRRFRRSLYLGGWLEGGDLWQASEEADLDDPIYTATVLLGADSRLGPAYFAYGITDEGQDRLYLLIGRTFTRP